MSFIIPVIDLLGGHVVRGIAGRRSEYQPIESPWSKRSDPVEIVCGLREAWGFEEFYVADLDAIQFDQPQWSAYNAMITAGVSLILDAGVRDEQSAHALIDTGIQRVVLALETLGDPQLLSAVTRKIGSERVVFSLDLLRGRPITKGSLEHLSPLQIAERAIEAGIKHMIVLDLAGVGVGEGIPTLTLCHQINERWPFVKLITGGGVRNAADITAAMQHGVQSVLVASALHDGRLTKDLFDDRD